MDVIVRIVAPVGTLASTVALIQTFNPKSISPGQGVLVVIAFACFITVTLVEILDWMKTHPHVYRTQVAIRNYMFNWISNGGRVVISSRDMTWAHNDPQMHDMLLTKARAGELTLCLPDAIPLSNELQDAGANIVLYPRLNYVPESRFTIIRYGHMDAKVAVGRMLAEGHAIEEFGVGEHPVFAVANDLIQVLKKSSAPRPRRA